MSAAPSELLDRLRQGDREAAPALGRAYLPSSYPESSFSSMRSDAIPR